MIARSRARAVALMLVCCLHNLSTCRHPNDGHQDSSKSEEITVPTSSKLGESTRPVRIIERSNRTHGITKGRAYNVTWHWVQEFFQDPKQHRQGRGFHDLLLHDLAAVHDNTRHRRKLHREPVLPCASDTAAAPFVGEATPSPARPHMSEGSRVKAIEHSRPSPSACYPIDDAARSAHHWFRSPSGWPRR